MQTQEITGETQEGRTNRSIFPVSEWAKENETRKLVLVIFLTLFSSIDTEEYLATRLGISRFALHRIRVKLIKDGILEKKNRSLYEITLECRRAIRELLSHDGQGRLVSIDSCFQALDFVSFLMNKEERGKDVVRKYLTDFVSGGAPTPSVDMSEIAERIREYASFVESYPPSLQEAKRWKNTPAALTMCLLLRMRYSYSYRRLCTFLNENKELWNEIGLRHAVRYYVLAKFAKSLGKEYMVELTDYVRREVAHRKPMQQ
jgi:hypothetical protein